MLAQAFGQIEVSGLNSDAHKALSYQAEHHGRSFIAPGLEIRPEVQEEGSTQLTASALLASIGNGHDFKNGRQVAAWIGLTPGQHSSGGKTRLGRITKAGDGYLRSLLVMGARAILARPGGGKQDGFSRWARSPVERRGYWNAVVAIAAKNARLAWTVLHYGEDFRLSKSAA